MQTSMLLILSVPNEHSWPHLQINLIWNLNRYKSAEFAIQSPSGTTEILLPTAYIQSMHAPRD